MSTIAIVTVPDITGDAANHAVSTGTARWIQFVAPAANAANVRVGDSNISSTRGIPIPPGGSMFLPESPDLGLGYDLANVFYRATTGDIVSIAWAV